MNNDPMAFLLGGGVKSAKFDSIGVTVGGPITEQPELQQQKDFETGEPKFWPDGSPANQLVVTVQTELRDPEDPEDDGVRRFYVKANLQKAVAAAVRAAGAKSLEPGGTLTVTYSGDGTASKRGFNPPKLYTATYTPPAENFLQQPAEPAPAVVAPAQQQPAAAAPAANPLAGLSAEALAALQALQIQK